MRRVPSGLSELRLENSQGILHTHNRELQVYCLQGLLPIGGGLIRSYPTSVPFNCSGDFSKRLKEMNELIYFCILFYHFLGSLQLKKDL
jgi:hypothetical protein